MAAETGSGKTGAFCLPVIQIVYETLKDIQEQKGMSLKNEPKAATSAVGFKMSAYDRDISRRSSLEIKKHYIDAVGPGYYNSNVGISDKLQTANSAISLNSSGLQ